MNSIKTLREYLKQRGPFEPLEEPKLTYPCFHTQQSLESAPEGEYLVWMKDRKTYSQNSFTLKEVQLLSQSTDSYEYYGPIPHPTNGAIL